MRSYKLTSLIFRLSFEAVNIAVLISLVIGIIFYFVAPIKLANFALRVGINPVDGLGSILLFATISYIFLIGSFAVIIEARENSKHLRENSEQMIDLLRSISNKISNYESRMARQTSEGRRAETSSRYEAIYQNMKSVQQQGSQSNRNGSNGENSESVPNQSRTLFERKI